MSLFKALLSLLIFACFSSLAHAVETDNDSNGFIDVSYGGTNTNSAAGIRTLLGLGTVYQYDVGTGANNIVQLDGSGDLPFAIGLDTTNFDGIFSNTTSFDTIGEVVEFIDNNVPTKTSTDTMTNKTMAAGSNSFTGFPYDLCVAASDETTDLTTGTAKITFRVPIAFTLTDVRASVNTAPAGSTITVDVNEGGVSVLSTVISIDAAEKTSTTAATAAVISDSSIADDAEMTIDIDQIGSSTAGKGLKVCLIGTIDI